MQSFTPEIVTKRTRLQRLQCRWELLWSQSDSCCPCSRAHHVQHWTDTFGQGSLKLLCVWQEHELVGILPIIDAGGGWLKNGVVPGNAWSPAGDLIVSSRVNTRDVMEKLVDMLDQLRLDWLSIDELSKDLEPWSTFISVLRKRRRPFWLFRDGEVGIIDVEGKSWDDYLESRSKTLRKQIRRCVRRFESNNGLRFESHSQLNLDDVEPMMMRGFAVEKKSWKGPEGTAILDNENAKNFYLEQAATLAASNELALFFLTLHGETIAWEYGCFSGNKYFSLKIGYDKSFKHLSPGVTILAKIVQEACKGARFQRIDGTGTVSEDFSRWCTDTYVSNSLHIPCGIRSKAELHVKFLFKKLAQRLARVRS